MLENSIESEKTLERLLTRKVKENLGGLSLKMVSTHMIGLPDRLCLVPPGRIFFAEIKTTKQKPRKIQLIVHEKLRRLGFRVEVIDTSDQINKLIKEYEKK